MFFYNVCVIRIFFNRDYYDYDFDYYFSIEHIVDEDPKLYIIEPAEIDDVEIVCFPDCWVEVEEDGDIYWEEEDPYW